ncbi:uncharacterized protein LOC126979242 [Leptidea sinapis]|uniref:uncharacterized protein LOC126979242 n=1 Tax=Leptidea sinapis TaxID=189913 RepID=UPI00213A6551|nr:uncharacterized protein LOC126979242 [Leptidea sinapis]
MHNQQQSSNCNVHPYQTTLVSRSEQQFATASRQRAKYPWVEISAPVYQAAGTDSSTTENAYHVPNYYQSKDYIPTSPVYHSPYGTVPWKNYAKGEKSTSSNTYSFPVCASAFSLPLCDGEQLQTADQSPIETLPPATPEVPILGACGGHCPGFEYVCYYILQVIFVVGILTGISLCIAGIVLRRTNRNGDLGVLVYIGCLSSCVCGVLLGVQCCVRREIKQRKMRAMTHIPMQSMQEVPTTTGFPLLPPALPQHQVYRPTVSDVEEDLLGVPWWRRTNRD